MADITADEAKPDVIVVTHGHADHMGDTLTIAKRTACKVIAVNEIAKYLQSVSKPPGRTSAAPSTSV